MRSILYYGLYMPVVPVWDKRASWVMFLVDVQHKLTIGFSHVLVCSVGVVGVVIEDPFRF